MHRPAALSGSTSSTFAFLQSLKGRVPAGRRLAKAGGGLAAVVALLIVVALFTPLAHPRDLQVEGVSGSSADRIRAAIEETASGQSTFLVSEQELMEAVQDFPEVASVQAEAHPPFRLDLTVVMRPPVARLQVGGHSFVVAGDGTILERAGSASVPRVDASISGVHMKGDRVIGGRGALTVLAAAPEELLSFARTIRAGQSGLEVVLTRGPRLIFGNGTAAADKWAAAAAVIADGAAARATYIDLRVPSRPAVGGLGGSRAAGAEDAPPSLTAASPEAAATAATLAAGQAAVQHSTGTQSASGPVAEAQAGAAPSASATAPQQAAPAASATGNGTSESAPVEPSAQAPDTSGSGAGTGASGGGASIGGGTAP